MEKRLAKGDTYSIRELVAILVPVCTDIIRRHESGEHLLVTPSSIRFQVGTPTGWIPGQAAPLTTRDRACLPPESRTGRGDGSGNKGGDSRSSVFSIGAIAYEMLTGETVGPGMRRPSELVKDLPPTVETILSKALIGDRAHRPAELGALAQAIHNLAPAASMAPPVDKSASLDDDDNFEIDVSLSLLPPPSSIAPSALLPRPPAAPLILTGTGQDSLIAVASIPKQPSFDPTSALARLRDRLEADPRPRYLVIKDGMDHGPFSAVELLQQVASLTFESHHILVDTFSQDERPISEWDEFAPFAEHANLNRQLKAEKKEIERAVVAESKSTRDKALIIGLVSAAGIAAIVALVVLFAGKKTSNVSEERIGHSALNIDFGGEIENSAAAQQARARGARGGGIADGVNRPVLRGGMSCEQAMDTYTTELSMSGNKPDLTSGQLGASLNSGGYVVSCGAPISMTVNICAAIQNGRAVGVTVTTDPPNAGVASCISGAVRSMSFPSHPALDVTRTVFAGK